MDKLKRRGFSRYGATHMSRALVENVYLARSTTFINVIVITLLFLTILVSGCTAKQPPFLVCLSFDDGYDDNYQVALPVLLEFDFKATFGVIIDNIGIDSGVWHYMDENEIKILASYGMDIASHARTHSDLTSNLSDKQMRDEIIDSKKYLESLGFKVRTFISPFNRWDNKIVRYIKEAGYTCARVGPETPKMWNPLTYEKEIYYHIPSYGILDQSLDEFKTIVNRASNSAVVCLTYHSISDTGPKYLSTGVQDFYEQMRFLKENGFTVVLLPDLVEKARLNKPSIRIVGE